MTGHRVFLLICAMLAAAGCATPENRSTLASSRGASVELPTAYHDDFFLVSTQVEGRSGLSFLLDTGASHTILDDDIARSLPQGRFRRPGDRFRLRTLRAGSLEVENLEVLVHDMDTIAASLGRPLAGILGYDAFEHHLLTLDYPGRSASVRVGSLPPPDGRTVFPLAAKGRAYFDLSIHGNRSTFLIDSGSSSCLGVIRPDRLRWRHAPSPIGASTTIRGRESRLAGQLDGEIRFGPVSLVDPIAYLDPDMSTVGTKVLRYLVLTFDARNGRIAIDAGDRTRIDWPRK
ncbi:MAG: hypothetical protein CMJ83_06520 [Planctomycetes bacterium]|nr:hypothetical protein [Planctomycetota bacterium]